MTSKAKEWLFSFFHFPSYAFHFNLSAFRLPHSALFITLLASTSLCAARNRPSYEEDKSVMMREILDSLDNLRHDVNNHEAEIRMFEEKFKNQEEILDTMRNQTTATLQAVKESLKIQSASLDSRLSNHENTSKGLSNDHAQTLSEYKRRILDLEKMIEAQNRNIENMQAALSSLMDALQIKETSQDKTADIEAVSAKIYRVKSGDSLEKIARQNQTTIKKLKEVNNLTGDQIIIGQKLKLPE